MNTQPFTQTGLTDALQLLELFALQFDKVQINLLRPKLFIQFSDLPLALDSEYFV